MDFSFNRYLISGDERPLSHAGLRCLFSSVSEAVSRVVSIDAMRWISLGQVEADDCRSMNDWLAVAPQSFAAHGMTGRMVSLTDLADRLAGPLTIGDVLDIGGYRRNWLDAPHVPHGWEAGLFYDETTRTLLCGNLFTQTGARPATTTEDIVSPAIAGEDQFRASSLAPVGGATIRRLAELGIGTLALMHGPAYAGDRRGALLDLADDFHKPVAAAVNNSPSRFKVTGLH